MALKVAQGHRKLNYSNKLISISDIVLSFFVNCWLSVQMATWLVCRKMLCNAHW